MVEVAKVEVIGGSVLDIDELLVEVIAAAEHVDE